MEYFFCDFNLNLKQSTRTGVAEYGNWVGGKNKNTDGESNSTLAIPAPIKSIRRSKCKCFLG